MNRQLVALIVFVVLVAVASAEPARILHGRVLNVDGTPSNGTLVLPIGLDRGRIITEEMARQYPSWQYSTDRDGRFTVRFGAFVNQEPPTTSTLGWSTYCFFALPGKDDAGAISDRVSNSRWPGGAVNETGPTLIVGDKPLEITMRRKAGIVVEGYVIDASDLPVSTTVMINHDLHAGTHTGSGGEIFARLARTDSRGHYQFQRVYPATFNMGIPPVAEPGEPCVWLRTRVGKDGKWQDDRIDRIEVKPGQDHVRIDFGLNPRGQFVYRGKVTDESGRPIQGAKISLGYSHHEKMQDWSDFHSFAEAKTSADGIWEIKSSTKWIRFLRAEKVGYQPEELYDEREDGYAAKDAKLIHITPGVYDFKLKAEAKK